MVKKSRDGEIIRKIVINTQNFYFFLSPSSGVVSITLFLAAFGVLVGIVSVTISSFVNGIV